MRPLDGFKHTLRLVYGLLILALRPGVSHNAGTCLNIYLLILNEHGPDGDAKVHVAGKTEVTHSSRVWPALVLLQLFNNLHGPYFRRPGYRAGGKRGPENIIGVSSRLHMSRSRATPGA